jgi:serine/threonine protein kinase
VACDFGLVKEIGVGSTFTMSHEYWGTQGYLPPEFISEGFAKAEPSSDIFMLGKSFYSLLTNRDPMYITKTGVHEAVFHVIEKCTKVERSKRYQALGELKQGLSLAYDIILKRTQGSAQARQTLTQILERLSTLNQFKTKEVADFVALLSSLPRDDQDSIIGDLPTEFFTMISAEPLSDALGAFLVTYEPFVKPAVNTFSYAEVVAKNMSRIFLGSLSIEQRALALEFAVDAAIWANRFDAMDVCREFIMEITDDGLALRVATMIAARSDSFLQYIEPVSCGNEVIKRALREAKASC